MKIKEQDEQHMVIEVTRCGGFSEIIGLVFFSVCIAIAQTIPVILIRVALSLFLIYGILSMLRMLRATRVILDKPTQTVTIRKPSLFLFSRQRVILVSHISSVLIDLKVGTSEGEWSKEKWKVSLNIGGNKFEIAQTTNEADMLHLASELSKFTGRELIDNSAQPEYSFQRFFHKVKGFFRK